MSLAHLTMLADTAKLNKTPKDYQVGVRISTLDAAVAEFKRVTDLATRDLPTRCECCGDLFGFEVPIHRTDARPYLAMEQARTDRLLHSTPATAKEG